MLTLFLLIGASLATNFTEVLDLNTPAIKYGSPVSSYDLIDVKISNNWGQPPYQSEFEGAGDDFDHARLTLDFSTFGRQFDRLGHVFFENIEIWRFSTPEPSGRNITSTLVKDVSQYVELFKKGGNFSLGLLNVNDNTYTGVLNVSLSVDLFKSNIESRDYNQWWYNEPADKFTSLQTPPSVSIPPELQLSIPQVSRQTVRAGLQIFCSGAANEEFWYANLINQTGPTRQIQVLIGGVIAGFIDPFQTEYTGTDNPSWWAKLVGVQTYDIPCYFIDVSTFLPELWSGTADLEIDVVNGYNDEKINSEWIMNVALLTWEDSSTQGIGGFQVGANRINSPSVQTHKFGSDGNARELDYVSIDNSVSLSSTLFFTDRTVYTEWRQSGTERSAQDATQHNQTAYSWIKGKVEAQYGADSFRQSFEYPKCIYLSDDTSVSPFGSGAVSYSYVVDNSGVSSFTINNTITTSTGMKGTSFTDGYLGYNDGSEHFEHIRATSERPFNLVLDEKDNSWGGLVDSAWKQLFDDVDQCVNDGDWEGAQLLLSEFLETTVVGQ